MHRKSRTCIGKVSGEPVTEYDSEDEAVDGAWHARLEYGRDLIPYRCRRCRRWHLALRDRETPSRPCTDCTCSSGRAKQAYGSRAHAETRAELLRKERGVRLRVYACPLGSGWHLTSDLS